MDCVHAQRCALLTNLLCCSDDQSAASDGPSVSGDADTDGQQAIVPYRTAR